MSDLDDDAFWVDWYWMMKNSALEEVQDNLIGR